MTRREYYIARAEECLLASEQIPSDRDVLLHMAATYITIAVEIELRGAPGPGVSVRTTQSAQISSRDTTQPAAVVWAAEWRPLSDRRGRMLTTGVIRPP